MNKEQELKKQKNRLDKDALNILLRKSKKEKKVLVKTVIELGKIIKKLKKQEIFLNELLDEREEQIKSQKAKQDEFIKNLKGKLLFIGDRDDRRVVEEEIDKLKEEVLGK